ncbi:MAG: hypothetical protein P1P93_09330 [Gammaproteobacteria bacterium]|nr:hypothetical protein [Gammaproteobacteria bacterium]
MNAEELELKRASLSALASLLNLTVLPVIGFIFLLFLYKQTQAQTIGRYYAVLGIKINLAAAIALIIVTGLMLLLGGFYSPWTWVFVISYFVFVHALFILVATWILVRSWTGKKLTTTFL